MTNLVSKLWQMLGGARGVASSPSPTASAPTAPAGAANGRTPDASDELLARARALAGEGRTTEAAALYWKIKPSRRTLEALVEHAELLLRDGDDFGAAGRASRVLELDPANARALAVQRDILRREEGNGHRRK